MRGGAVAGGGQVWGPPLARAALVFLTAAFGVFPFRPPLERAGPRLAAASAILSAVFLYLALASRRRPARSFWTGFALVALVTVVVSMTGGLRQSAVWWTLPGLLGVLAFGALVSPGPDPANPEVDPGSKQESVAP